ncbi:MAG TPA: family 16 glycoside hydrolase [Planctomycetota bacterium]|nr:family 16 glycoside hydrolase [Planctomycetota bacterium]
MPWRVVVALAMLATTSVAGEGAPKARPFDGWTPTAGTWKANGEVYVQTELKSDCRAFAEAATWTDYVYEVKARKTGGAEGFLVLFRVKDRDHFYWWNIGGWGNNAHAVETRPKREFAHVPGRIETGKWYDVKVVVQGPSIRCYLDGKLIHDMKDDTYPAGGIGLGTWVTAAEYKDVSVAALDGRKLYGVDKMTLVEGCLKELGTAGESLCREADALRAAGAKPDDPRWQPLYSKAAALCDKLRNARQAIAAIDLATPRGALQRLAAGFPFAKAEAEGLLKELAAAEKLLKALRDALADGTQPDLAALMKIEETLGKAAAFERKLLIPRCPPIAFLKRNGHGLRGTNATMHSHMTGVGSAICTLDPATGATKVIFEDKTGFIMDMSPSYDGKRLVFTYKRDVPKREDSHHIWEISTDGTGLRQITNGRFHDFNPVYLPDGRICFASTRVEAYSMCQDFLACALFTVSPDGSDIRRLEYSTLCDVTPSVMDDGSVLYSRWEYQDKNIFTHEMLWTINPDGTRVQLFYGNTLTVPNSMYGAKQIPGTRKVICVMAAHHHPPLGAIGLIDRTLGHENVESIVNITPEVPYTPTVGRTWRDTNWGPGDKLYPWSYTDPYPIAEDLFLVSYGGPLTGGPKRYRLFLMDAKGNKALLYDDPQTSCFCPVPLRPRPRPHQFVGAPPAEPKGEGRFFCFDVYQGLLDKGVERGLVKELRVMSQLPKKYNTEGPRYSDHYPAIGEGTYYVKHNYGTVPVADDGSVYFTAPAGVELYFQALDANGKEVRRMGTVTQLVNGESQNCIGCHESRTHAPSPQLQSWKRLAKGPDRITPPPWGEGPVDFVKQVQPVFDKYCVKCHSGPTPDGGIDLSGDKTRLFNMAFETLVFTPGLVDRYHINPGPTGNFPPLATGSWVSRLTKLLEEKYKRLNVDDESRRRIYTWVDANVPYYGTWDMTRPHSFGGRDTWLDVGGRPLPWFAAFQKAYGDAFDKAAGESKKGRRGRIANVAHTDINLTHPEWSRVLVKNLAKSAGGLADDAKAAFKSKDDPSYQAILKAIEGGKAALLAKPRIDMPGAVAIPQQRDFGRTF